MAASRRIGGALLSAILLVASNQMLAPTLVGAASVAGGVTLDGYGGLHPFGGLNLNSSGAPYWGGWDVARAVVVRQDGSGGWTLEGFGGIHAFGNAAPIRTPAYWNWWDIARAFVV